MRSSAFKLSAMLVVLAACVTGCGPNHVRHTQTTLLPDGSVDRAVLLPLKDTPEAVLKDDAWTQATYMRQKTFDDFTGEIRKLPLQSHFPEGTADEALNGPDQGRNISARLGSRARYVELKGVGHLALLEDAAALAAVREFLENDAK